MLNVFQVLGAHFCDGKGPHETNHDRGPFNIMDHLDPPDQALSIRSHQTPAVNASSRHYQNQSHHHELDPSVIGSVGATTIAD